MKTSGFCSVGLAALVVAGAVQATGCASAVVRGQTDAVEALYQQAMEDLDDGLYTEALDGFASLKTKYPYSRFAALADLRTADTHFKRGKFLEAVDAYRSFLRFHPSHGDAAYAMFQIGEAYFEQAPEDWWFLPPAAEKDQGSTRLAITAYRDMLARFGSSEFAAPATEKLTLSLAKLAEHELYVARFYFQRERWKAAVSRAKGMLQDYPGSPYDAEGLWILGRGQLELADKPAAADALARLAKDFPASEYAGEAQVLLAGLGAVSQAPAPQAPAPQAPVPQAPAPQAPKVTP